MKPRTKKMLWIGLAVFGLIFLIYLFLCYPIIWPYPPKMYFEIKKHTTYSSAWPIIQAEYITLKEKVEKELQGHEIIYHIMVKSDSEIEIWTLLYWYGPLAASGRSFTFKKFDGKWNLIHIGLWDS